MKQSKWAWFVFGLTCLLLITSTARANDMQLQILNASINLGWATEVLEIEGLTATNFADISTMMTVAAEHLSAIEGMLEFDYQRLSIAPLITRAENWATATSSYSNIGKATYVRDIYEDLYHQVSSFIDARTSSLAYGVSCDTYFARVGFYYARAHMAAHYGDVSRISRHFGTMQSAINSGLNHSTCDFGTKADWDALAINVVDKSVGSFDKTLPQIQAIALNASTGMAAGPGGTPGVTPGGGSFLPAFWNGFWKTGGAGGDFIFVVNGNRLSGIVHHSNSTEPIGTIEGTLSGREIKGTWAIYNGTRGGTFDITMNPDNRSFSGWQYRIKGYDPSWHNRKLDWNGERVQELTSNHLAEYSRITGVDVKGNSGEISSPAASLSGTWHLNEWNWNIVIHQEGNRVSGDAHVPGDQRYRFRMEGTLNGSFLKGRWYWLEDSQTAGSFELSLNDKGNVLSGGTYKDVPPAPAEVKDYRYGWTITKK